MQTAMGSATLAVQATFQGCPGGSKTYKADYGQVATMCEWVIESGFNDDFNVQNAGAGAQGGVCDGAEGFLTFEPSANYTATTGLKEVINATRIASLPAFALFCSAAAEHEVWSACFCTDRRLLFTSRWES